MQIVIDIPASDYEAYKMQVKMIEQEGISYDSSNYELKRLIANGTPLPKGHGRLIDADALYDEYVKEPEEFNGGCSLMALFRAAPTIVEADRSEREEQ